MIWIFVVLVILIAIAIFNKKDKPLALTYREAENILKEHDDKNLQKEIKILMKIELEIY